jgi:hypothetical protein
MIGVMMILGGFAVIYVIAVKLGNKDTTASDLDRDGKPLNSNDSEIVSSEEQPVENLSEPQQEDVENHMEKAIFAVIFSAYPLALVAIYYAGRVKRMLKAGDLNAAREASKKANFWGNLSIIIGIIFWSVYITVLILDV